MKNANFILALLLAILSALPLASAATKETAEEKKEKEEEAIRQEAQKLIGDIGRKAVSGKIDVIKGDTALDAKPFPKVVAQITQTDGTSYPVMVGSKGLLSQITNYDKKVATVMGALLDKKEKGLFLIIDEIAAPPSAPVATLRKRGSPL